MEFGDLQLVSAKDMDWYGSVQQGYGRKYDEII